VKLIFRTRSSRRTNLVADQIERKIERRNRHDNAARHPQREPELARRSRRSIQRQQLAAQPLSLLGRQLDRFRGPRGFERAFGQRLAFF
jgi:hypothetical protein